MPALVLIPGLLCNHQLWTHQVEHLSHLAEVSVADVTRDDTIAAMANRVVQGAPPRFALAGLSMGGYVAQEIMRTVPERVQRLALLNTSARPDTPEQSARRRGLIELSRTGQFKGVTPRLLPLLIHPDRLDDGQLTARIQAMAEDVGQEGFVRQQTAILGRPDAQPNLSRISVPTLVIGAEDDLITPPEVLEEIATGIPRSTLRVLSRCGHLSTMEEPESVTGLMASWLTS